MNEGLTPGGKDDVNAGNPARAVGREDVDGDQRREQQTG